MSIQEQLALDGEGLKLKVYRCSRGYLTIGRGRNLETKGISLAEADHLFNNDLEDARCSVYRALPWAMFLDEVRLAILYDMAFNLGTAGLLQFKRMLFALERKNYQTAAMEMINSKWYKQVGRRGPRLVNMMATGHWPGQENTDGQIFEITS